MMKSNFIYITQFTWIKNLVAHRINESIIIQSITRYLESDFRGRQKHAQSHVRCMHRAPRGDISRSLPELLCDSRYS